MPPKKADKGAKPAVKKEAVDKASFRSLTQLVLDTDNDTLDIWHEKCTSPAVLRTRRIL